MSSTNDFGLNHAQVISYVSVTDSAKVLQSIDGLPAQPSATRVDSGSAPLVHVEDRSTHLEDRPWSFSGYELEYRETSEWKIILRT